MKYVIDESICKKHYLSIAEVFAGLLVKANPNINELFSKLKGDNCIKTSIIGDNNYFLDKEFDNIICSILLDSEKELPTKNNCEDLATELRAMFPKGMKVANTAWRGNLREITLRLQKFFKLYGNQWTNEEIIAATKKYIDHFHGDFTYMRVLKYFILKAERKLNDDGTMYVEEISELATYLENNTDIIEENEDWTTEMR